MRRWYVATMDEGVHTAKPTMDECLHWIRARGTPVQEVIRYGPGNYTVRTCFSGDGETATDWAVVRSEMVGVAGIDLDKWVELPT